jgi:sugar/nucleoside kinase (ribokinase family)
MVCCARLGWRARYVGRFGSDEIGALGLASLTSEGVDVSATQQVDSPTRFAMVLVDARTGDRTVLWDRDPKLVIRPGDIGQEVWASARALHVDCEDIPAATEAARIAIERRAHGDRRRGRTAGCPPCCATSTSSSRPKDSPRSSPDTTTPDRRSRRWRGSMVPRSRA